MSTWFECDSASCGSETDERRLGCVGLAGRSACRSAGPLWSLFSRSWASFWRFRASEMRMLPVVGGQRRAASESGWGVPVVQIATPIKVDRDVAVGSESVIST